MRIAQGGQVVTSSENMREVWLMSEELGVLDAIIINLKVKAELMAERAARAKAAIANPIHHEKYAAKQIILSEDDLRSLIGLVSDLEDNDAQNVWRSLRATTRTPTPKQGMVDPP